MSFQKTIGCKTYPTFFKFKIEFGIQKSFTSDKFFTTNTTIIKHKR